MVAALLSRLTILITGLLYPAYSSFKAVRSKNHREYTKWMMYWIVFALFQAVEWLTDMFLTWLPLYFELKMVFVLWLVLPITGGSKQVYRLIVHPFLLKHEKRIDKGISQAGQTGLETVKKLSQAGLNKAATTVVSSAIMGQAVLTETLLRSREESMSERGEEQQGDYQAQDEPPPSPSSNLEEYDVIDDPSSQAGVTHHLINPEETLWTTPPTGTMYPEVSSSLDWDERTMMQQKQGFTQQT